MGNENQVSQILDGLLFPKIFRSFRMAIQPSKLIIALGMIAVIGLTGWFMDLLSKSVVATPGTDKTQTELQVYMIEPERVEAYTERYTSEEEYTGVFTTLWHFGADRFHGALSELFAFNLPGVLTNVAEYIMAVRWAMNHHPIYCGIFAVIKLCIICIGGGAICRIAALQFARNEKPGITEALRFSSKKFVSFFTTPLFPVVIIILAGLCIFLLGLVANIPFFGELIAGILMPLALLGGALVAIFVIGTIAGFNLMYPAIAYDGSDSLDAVSRSFNYIYARPWRMGLYTTATIVYGAICYVFVRFFAFLLLWSTYFGLRLGAWADSSKGLTDKVMAVWSEPSFGRLLAYSANAGNWSESAAAFLVYVFALIIVGLVVSFIISFYFSANTVIYALMRNKVDNTPLEEIYTEPEQTKTIPAEIKEESPESQ